MDTLGASREVLRARILDFSLAFDLTITNMCFRKRDVHLITYKSGVPCSQIDFFFIRNQIGRFAWIIKLYQDRAWLSNTEYWLWI